MPSGILGTGTAGCTGAVSGAETPKSDIPESVRRSETYRAAGRQRAKTGTRLSEGAGAPGVVGLSREVGCDG